MKQLLQSESLLACAASLAALAFIPLPFHWAWHFLIFFLPDIGMLGYLAGPRVGAITYNTLHHQGLALGILLLGLAIASPLIQYAGIIIFAHAHFDRMLGYGLKHFSGFKDTHLGRLPEAKRQRP